jgi:hypothetical protein
MLKRMRQKIIFTLTIAQWLWRRSSVDSSVLLTIHSVTEPGVGIKLLTTAYIYFWESGLVMTQ